MGSIGKTLGFIGAGQMGSALIKGFIEKGLFTKEELFASDPSPERRAIMEEEVGIQVFEKNAQCIKRSQIIVLAVKPQVMDLVLREINEFIEPTHLVISIAAGVSIGFIEKGLPPGTRVIRVMPNTPALIHEGAAGIAKGSNATDQDLELALSLFQAVGVAVSVPEPLLDAVTGLSGSGPAYVFRFIEALVEGGIMEGLPRDVAFKLSVQTVIGAAKLLQKLDKHPGELEAMVTSPGGTTIKALYTLEKNLFTAGVMEAVHSATARSKELGKMES